MSDGHALPPPPSEADRDKIKAITDELKAGLNDEPKRVSWLKVILVAAIIGILGATSILGYRLVNRTQAVSCDPTKRPTTPTTVGQIYVCDGNGNWVLV